MQVKLRRSLTILTLLTIALSADSVGAGERISPVTVGSAFSADRMDMVPAWGILDIQDRRAARREDDSQLPTEFRLDQNYPNPFNPVTMIRYAVPQAGPVTLTVYSVLGQTVRVLVDHYHEAGTYRIDWDGRDDAGSVVATGLYLYRLEASDFSQTRRMVFMK